ncbi:MAG: energy transducer TonB [Flavobacteriales bacterium]|nr:energy transducer TonB [Flavobacteriales bacterium]
MKSYFLAILSFYTLFSFSQVEPVIRVKKNQTNFELDSLKYTGNLYDFNESLGLNIRAPQRSPFAPAAYSIAPRFRKDDYNASKYLRENLEYPVEIKDQDIEGAVHVNFNISPAGNLSDFKVFRKLHPTCDAIALKLVSSMPKWDRGEIKEGKRCKTNHTVRVVFNKNG